jgi:hypothetical protein
MEFIRTIIDTERTGLALAIVVAFAAFAFIGGLLVETLPR